MIQPTHELFSDIPLCCSESRSFCCAGASARAAPLVAMLSVTREVEPAYESNSHDDSDWTQ